MPSVSGITLQHGGLCRAEYIKVLDSYIEFAESVTKDHGRLSAKQSTPVSLAVSRSWRVGSYMRPIH